MSRLKIERHRRGWSQQKVADLVGTTSLNVSRWERGLTRPSPYFRQKLCDLFGMSGHTLGILPENADGCSIADLKGEKKSAMQESLYDPAMPLRTAMMPLIGRDEEMSRFKRQILATQGVPFVAISGLPGVGKTALASELVSDPEVCEQFDGGILWATLGPDARVHEVLRRWAGLLDISESEAMECTTPEMWAYVMRASMGARRYLLVLDDVWRLQEALLCMVGGPQCAYVLTTRLPQVALAFAGSGAKTLKTLNDEQSMQFIRFLAPGVKRDELEILHAILQAVDGLPLALLLIGNHLRMLGHSGQPRRTHNALLQLLHPQVRLTLTDRRPNAGRSEYLSPPNSLGSAIAHSVQWLDASARQALYALSFSPPKLPGFSEEEALVQYQTPIEILDALSDAGLLESAGPGRYMLHPTIADYARLYCRE